MIKKSTLLIIFILLITACEKYDLDRKEFLIEISTDEVTVSGTTITAGGTISALGKGVEDHGHVWATSSNPTIDDNKNSIGLKGNEGSYTSQITNLESATTYYIRAFATDGEQTFYGEEKSVITSDVSITLDSVTIINATTANAFATINSLGARPVQQHGFCWSLTTNEPTINDEIAQLGSNPTAPSTINTTLNNLIQDSTYHIRAFITNDQTTIYSNTINFAIGNASVTTLGIQINTSSEATATGAITGLGTESIIQHGHCWSSTNLTPDINDFKNQLGATSSAGNFNSTLNNLTTNTPYYYRSYAQTSNTVVYGEVQTFIINEHQVSTDAINITSVSSADATGTLTIGDYSITEHGHCWSSSNNIPTVNDDKTSLGQLVQSGSFTSNLTNLGLGTTYYIRAYAQAGNVIRYGAVQILQIPPHSLDTGAITVTSISTADLTATLNTTYAIDEHGHCWSTSPNPTINNNKTTLGINTSGGVFSSTLNNLTTNTTYYIRGYATSGGQTFYSSSQTIFIVLHSLDTGSVNITSDTTATINATLNLTSYNITEHGHCWSTSPNPTISDAKTTLGSNNLGGLFSSNLTGLNSGTTYYVRSYATSGNVTIYGNSQVFTTTINMWFQQSDFGGTARYGAVGFSIGTKGYIGTGAFNNGGLTDLNDFWEYNPSLDVWTQKADFGGTARRGAVGFSIGTKGYIGTGRNGGYEKDFWEYEPTTNTWTQKADFGGTTRQLAVGFSVGTKGYIGTGLDGSSGTSTKDFWEYEPTTNTWTQKADFGGTGRYGAVGFPIGTKGYIGTGRLFDNGTVTLFNDFWEYNPSLDIWTSKTDFSGVERFSAVGFSTGTKGYIGTGVDVLGSEKKDFWLYIP